MNAITAWFNAHSLSTKVIIAGILALAPVVAYNTTVQAQLAIIFKSNPQIVSVIVALATIILTIYSPKSDAGVLAHANAIKDQPDAPTAAQVDAATQAKVVGDL